MDIKKQIQSLTGSLLDEMTEIRRHLHRYPELSFREEKTSGYIRALLDSWGVAYKYPFAGTGIAATVSGKGDGPCIALRADMDALPIREESGVPFESDHPGIMHACGHDVHMTCMLGVIRIALRLREHFPGELLFLFQPGEEKVPGGARKMIDEGVFRDKRPDVILAQHVYPELEAGRVGMRSGTYMASSDEIYLTVRGKGGHGALPRNLNDPVLMAAHILVTLQQEVRRKAPPGVPTVLSFGKIEADGAVNVIPDVVTLEGTFRTMNEAWREEAHGMIRSISDGIAKSLGGSCETDVRKGYPVLRNDEALTARARDLASSFLGAQNVEELDIRMTAEDFAWFALEVPGLMYRLGVAEKGGDTLFPLHTPGFRVDEEALRTGISLMTYLAVEMARQKNG